MYRMGGGENSTFGVARHCCSLQVCCGGCAHVQLWGVLKLVSVCVFGCWLLQAVLVSTD